MLCYLQINYFFLPKTIKSKPGQCHLSYLHFLILHRPSLRPRPLYSPRPRPHSSRPLQPPQFPRTLN